MPIPAGLLAKTAISASSANAGGGLAMTMGSAVVADFAMDALFDEEGNVRADLRENDDVRVQIIRGLPAEVKRAADEDPDLIDSILDYFVDSVEEFGAQSISEVMSVVEDEFILRFGPDWVSSTNDRVDLADIPTRNPGNALTNLLLGDTLSKEIVPPMMMGSNPFYFAEGLVVVIAPSGTGKTSFFRQVFKNLARATDEYLAFVPWNEREKYSIIGPRTSLVSALENACNAASIVGLDSIRDQVIGGRSPGKGGLNTNFLLNLTQWHHTFADRGVCVFAVINPIIDDEDFTATITEIARGSTNGFLHLTSKGKGYYEHVNGGRKRVNVNVPEDFGDDYSVVSSQAKKIDNDDVVTIEAIDLDETRLRRANDFLV